MTQDKMRRVITACVAAATVLLTCLTVYISAQWITIAVYDNKMKKVQAEIAYWTEAIEKAETDAEYYESDFYLKQAYMKLQMLENNK